MMKSGRHTLVLVLLLFSSTFALAQDTDAGWDIKQQCVTNETIPPDNWSFDGTILLEGHFGIHAINANFDTPYVVSFIDWSESLSVIDLSPDKKWGVRSVGKFVNTTTENNAYVVGFLDIIGLEIFSLENPNEKQLIPLDIHYEYRGATHPTPYPQPEWIDKDSIAFNRNRHIVATNHIIEPDPDTPRTFDIVWAIERGFYSSPDWTRQARHYTYGGIYGDIGIIDLENDKSLGGVSIYLLSNNRVAGGQDVIWSPDSSKFVVLKPHDDITYEDISSPLPNIYMSIYDRDVNLVADVLNSEQHRVIDIADAKRFNYSGNKLAFFTQIEESGWTLHIADLDDEVIIDTCLDVDSTVAWSPDDSKIALIQTGDDHRQVYIFDTVEWELYTVAYHDGEIITWRSD